jgi:hypothetical protein
VVLLLAILLALLLMVLSVVLLVVLLQLLLDILELGRHLLSPGEISSSPQPRLQSSRDFGPEIDMY